MAHVEQAVFTSAETSRSAGYQMVGKSPGISRADERALSTWGPSHDSLLELGPDAVSFNFHPLPSGAYCVSRTTPAGWEYSGRGGHRVYTQCLVVPPDVLAAFANNPLALIEAATAAGILKVHDRVPKQLEPLTLSARSAPVDEKLLSSLAADPGPHCMAALVQAALDSPRLAVAGTRRPAELIAGLLDCLPVECRREFSFSTGLKFSSRRPFRIVALSGDQAEQRWVAHQHNVTVLNLSDRSWIESAPIDGWARLIERVLASGRISLLAAELSKRRCDLVAGDLPALGLQLLEDLDASAFREDQRTACLPFTSVGVPDESKKVQPAHAAHHRFQKSVDTATMAEIKAAAPSTALGANSPEIRVKLEQLDDVVYEAIHGQATAMVQLQTLWPEILGDFGQQLVAESREQYLRYALTIWEECFKPDRIRNPSRAMLALDVLCVLFDEA